MADDWQMGDLAMAVARGASHFVAGAPALGHKAPQIGGIYKVEALVRDTFGNLGLVLEGHHSAHYLRAWMASQFRRIPPLSDEERDGFLADLGDIQRTPVEARAP